MKKLLYIPILFLCSCITITKNYYPKEVIKESFQQDVRIVPCYNEAPYNGSLNLYKANLDSIFKLKKNNSL